MSFLFRRLTSPAFNVIRRTAATTGGSDGPTELCLTFGSPSKGFYDQQVVKQVDIPGLFAYSGVVKEHVPFITALRPGIVKVTENDGTDKSFFVSSGTATFNADSTMQILAEEACTLEAIDSSAVSNGLRKAQEDLSKAKDDVERAEASIAVEAYEALSRVAGN